MIEKRKRDDDDFDDNKGWGREAEGEEEEQEQEQEEEESNANMQITFEEYFGALCKAAGDIRRAPKQMLSQQIRQILDGSQRIAIKRAHFLLDDSQLLSLQTLRFFQFARFLQEMQRIRRRDSAACMSCTVGGFTLPPLTYIKTSSALMLMQIGDLLLDVM